MKKTDIKPLIIGFLASTCLFLFMGLTEITNKYGGVLKVEVVNSSFPKSLDVNIKDFPSYDKIKVDVTDMP
tara:strand:- start:60 stop:272 length:213 start_codon:yes stop_codon:yes gene_type:complete